MLRPAPSKQKYYSARWRALLGGGGVKDAQQADRLLGLGHAHTVDYGDSGRHPGSSCHPLRASASKRRLAECDGRPRTTSRDMADAHDAMARQRTREFAGFADLWLSQTDLLARELGRVELLHPLVDSTFASLKSLGPSDPQ